MSNIELSRAQRLDQRVVELIPKLSRGFAARLIEDEKVTVNGIVQKKAGYKLREDDQVVIDFDEKELDHIVDIDLPVLYEDEDCVVINKPVGVLAHSKGVFNPEATVATWLRTRLIGLEGNRAGIVHRLDRATSGVMICAKTPTALSFFQKQFGQRTVKKTYVAVVKGVMKLPEALIDMPIERNPKMPARFRVGAQGKQSQTAYRVLSTNGNYSLLELKPKTGRTHQLRVHLAHQGHPIVGDFLYEGEEADRLYLHAAELELTLVKDHERKVFTAPIPPEFAQKVSA